MARIATFDEHAEQYDAWFDRHREIYLAELAAVRELIPVGGKGVEIGIGTGRFAGPLGIPVGVEPSPRMAELARRHGLLVFEATAEALPFSDGEFDFVLMVTVICFLDDVELALREAHRVLRPEGALVIGFIDRESALGRQYRLKRIEACFTGMPPFIPFRMWKACCHARGFPILNTGKRSSGTPAAACLLKKVTAGEALSLSEAPSIWVRRDPASCRPVGRKRDPVARREGNAVVKLRVFHSGNPG